MSFKLYLSILPLLVSASLLQGQSNVLTSRNNTWRDGLNSTEITLTQATVTKSKFGKICSTEPGALDGQIYAQPLVVTGGVPGYIHVVYVATMNDTLYFIDGDSPDCAVIKQISLLKSGEKAVKCTDVGNANCATFAPIAGILGTPVIDATTHTMYVVTWTESTAKGCPAGGSCFTHHLHALDIATGAEKFKGPAAIPSVTRGASQFSSKNHLQRAGLLLLPQVKANGDGALYVAFSEMDNSGVIGQSVPNGWVFSFDAQNLAATPLAWSTTPNGQGGGIWMSGAGLAAGVDQAGGHPYIYLSTGDGTFDAESGGSDYGDSFVKLTTALSVSNYFTPYKQYCDDIGDRDLGSGGVMLIPNGAGSSVLYFALANGKDGNIYVMDRANPGRYAGPAGALCPGAAGPDLNHETVAATTHQFYGTAAFWNQELYAVANNAPLQKYKISSTACNPAPVCQTATASSAASFTYGPSPVISSDGDKTGTGIVWVINAHGWPSYSNPDGPPKPGVLYALDAEHVQAPATIPMLWNSSQCPGRDGAGNATKFAAPTVANGRVFIGSMDPTDATNTRGELDVYGPNSNPCY